MEPELVPYSPILHRPKLRWPDDARVALWVVPNIEHYEYLPAFVRTRDPWPRSPHPDVLGYSQRDYGNRVGLWRLFELTDALGIRCTVSLSMAVLQHFPEILGAMERAAGSTCRTASTTPATTGIFPPTKSAPRWRSRRTSTSA